MWRARRGSLSSLAPSLRVHVLMAETQGLVLGETSEMEEEIYHSSSVKLLLFQMRRILGA